MVRCGFYKSRLYPILEEEPEEKKPTRAPYRGRKSMFLERPVEVKKLHNISHPEMEDLKQTHEMESDDSGIHLEMDQRTAIVDHSYPVSNKFENNNFNVPDQQIAEMILDHSDSVSNKIENNSYNVPDQQTAEMIVDHSYPVSNKFENNNFNVPDQQTAEMILDHSYPVSNKIENNSYNVPDQQTAEMILDHSYPVSNKFENNNFNVPDQQTAEMILDYSYPVCNKIENNFMDVPHLSLEPGNNPPFSAQTYPDGGYYYISPFNQTCYLYCGDYVYPHQENFVNFNAVPSTDPYCADLPFLEPGTLQFFYNLGWEYFHAVNAANNYYYSQTFNPKQHKNYIPKVEKRNYNNSGYNSGYKKDFINSRKFRRGEKVR